MTIHISLYHPDKQKAVMIATILNEEGCITSLHMSESDAENHTTTYDESLIVIYSSAESYETSEWRIPAGSRATQTTIDALQKLLQVTLTAIGLLAPPHNFAPPKKKSPTRKKLETQLQQLSEEDRSSGCDCCS